MLSKSPASSSARRLRRAAVLGSALALLGAVSGAATADVTADPVDPSTASAAPAEAASSFTLVLSDDFDGASLDSAKWPTVYSGQDGPGGTQWDPSQVSVANGFLNIASQTDPQGRAPGVSGGISNSQAGNQTYGKYEIRMRTDVGQGYTPAVLLWPADFSWPPEIDFMECPSAAKDKVYFTNHYDPTNQMESRDFSTDCSGWHTYAVEWTPSQIVFSVDGVPLAPITANIPSIPMYVAIQAQTGPSCDDPWTGCVQGGPYYTQVDWFRQYAYTPGG
ncbi:MAG: glycoside hydrolase family 16 protein [Nocardioides sp.]